MFKDRLKEARLACCLTQNELAERVGIVNSTIAGYEIGRSEPDMEKLSRIMKVLKVDANFLLQDEMSEESTPQPPLTGPETELLRTFRGLNETAQEMLLGTARAFAGNPDMQKEAGASASA